MILAVSTKNDLMYIGMNGISGISLSKKMEVIPEQNESDFNKSMDNRVDPSIYGFGIDAIELEKIIGKYKERGIDCQDLKYFQENDGPQKLFRLLKTNIETGIPDAPKQTSKYFHFETAFVFSLFFRNLSSQSNTLKTNIF